MKSKNRSERIGALLHIKGDNLRLLAGDIVRIIADDESTQVVKLAFYVFSLLDEGSDIEYPDVAGVEKWWKANESKFRE